MTAKPFTYAFELKGFLERLEAAAACGMSLVNCPFYLAQTTDGSVSVYVGGDNSGACKIFFDFDPTVSQLGMMGMGADRQKCAPRMMTREAQRRLEADVTSYTDAAEGDEAGDSPLTEVK